MDALQSNIFHLLICPLIPPTYSFDPFIVACFYILNGLLPRILFDSYLVH